MKKGFTLIEILIVVAIISILASVVLVGLGPTQRAGRDARRISDLRQIQTALELYFNKCGYYPGIAASPACATAFTPTAAADRAQWTALSTILQTSGIGIVNPLPNDPTLSASYKYGVAPAPAGNSYVIGATLEDSSNPALNQDVDGAASVNFGVDCADPVYCLQL